MISFIKQQVLPSVVPTLDKTYTTLFRIPLSKKALLGVFFKFFVEEIFFYLGLLSQPLTNHRSARKGEAISLTTHYHFHPLHRHLDICLAITGERLPLHIGSSLHISNSLHIGSNLRIGSSWIRTGKIWFPSASR